MQFDQRSQGLLVAGELIKSRNQILDAEIMDG